MRRLIKIALIVLGIRAFLRWRKRRHEVQEPTSAPAPTIAEEADPADELRRKLAESRNDGALHQVEAEETPPAAVADRRAEVHEQGQAALDAMKSSDEG